MPCHIPGSRASNLRLQRKSLDLPELGLARFALRHESTRSRTARLGKGVAKDCSFAISKINVGDRDNKTGSRARNCESRLNSEGNGRCMCGREICVPNTRARSSLLMKNEFNNDEA